MKLWSWLKSSWFPKMLNDSRDNDDSSWGDDEEQFYLPTAPWHFQQINCYSDGSTPRPRSGHRMVTDSHGNIFVLGGYNPEGLQRDDSPNALFKELWKFNMFSCKWSEIEMTGTPPKLLCSFGATCIDDQLFVLGGTGVPFGRNGSNRLYVCQLATGFWKKYKLRAENDDIPPKQYGQALAFDSEELNLYSIGGTCGHNYNLGVTRINLRNLNAEIIYPYNSYDEPGSYRHEVALHDNKIYLFGGGTSTLCIGFVELLYFDLSCNSWKRVKTFPDPIHGYPVPRKFHGLVMLEEYVYIIAGATSSEYGPIGLNDCWRFNLHTFEWTFMLRISYALYFHSMSLSSLGLMSLFGGVVTNTDRTHISTTRTDALFAMWLKIPTLAELAWLNLMKHFPELTDQNESKLLDIGIPPSYVARLQTTNQVKQ